MAPSAAVRKADGDNWLGVWEQMLLYIFLLTLTVIQRSQTLSAWFMVLYLSDLRSGFEFTSCSLSRFEHRGVEIIFPEGQISILVSLKRAGYSRRTIK